MLSLIKNEIYKAVRLKKGFLFMGVSLAFQAFEIFHYKFMPEGKTAFSLNGQSFTLEMIANHSIIMVMFIAVLAADMIADEYRNGTFKLVLLRPVNRIQFIGAKAVALMASIVGFVSFTVITSSIVGAIAFDWGHQLLYQGVPIAGNSMTMTLKSAIASMLPSAGFGMVILFIALLTEHAGFTIGAAMSLFLFSPLLERYGTIGEYSIISLMNTFYEMMIHRATLAQISAKTGIIAVYITLFFIGSAVLMKRKDVLL